MCDRLQRWSSCPTCWHHSGTRAGLTTGRVTKLPLSSGCVSSAWLGFRITTGSAVLGRLAPKIHPVRGTAWTRPTCGNEGCAVSHDHNSLAPLFPRAAHRLHRSPVKLDAVTLYLVVATGQVACTSWESSRRTIWHLLC